MRSCAWGIWTSGVVVDARCSGSSCFGVVHFDEYFSWQGHNEESTDIGIVELYVLGRNGAL